MKSSKTHVPPSLHFRDSRQLCSLVLFTPRCISLSLRGRKLHFHLYSSASCKLNPYLKAIATNALSTGTSCHFAHQSFELHPSIFHGCTRWRRNLAYMEQLYEAAGEALHGAAGCSATKSEKMERGLKCFHLRMKPSGAIESERS